MSSRRPSSTGPTTPTRRLTTSTAAALGSPTVVNGVFDTADFTWSTVTGDQSEIIILWDDTLTNDRLVSYMDTGITGMPVTPNGGNINVTVNGSGWFAI